MFRSGVAPIFLAVLLLPALAAASMDNARFALHRKAVPPVGTTRCDNASTPTIEPNYSPNYDALPCGQYTVDAPLGASLVYLVVGQAGPEGVAGVSFGIDYDGRANQQTGIDPQYVSFTMCANGLMFPNDGGFGEFPAPKGGTRVTWTLPDGCQNQVIGSSGVHAVIGALYVYAYSEDVLRLTPNNNLGLESPELAVVDCSNVLTDLIDLLVPVESLVGRVQFGTGTAGFTPCSAAPCAISVAAMSVKPNMIKLGTGGMTITTQIELPAGYDPAQVSLATVEMNGVAALLNYFQIGDFNHNNVPDFAVKFPRDQVEATLQVGDQVPVTVTGDIGACTFTGTQLIKVTSGGGGSSVEVTTSGSGISAPRLRQDVLNQSRGASRVSFDLPEPGPVTLKVFDLSGREVRILADAWYPAGAHEVRWDAADAAGNRVAAGIYFLHMKAGSFTDTQRMYLQK